MLQKVYSAGISGIDGYEVTVECSASGFLGDFNIVGLPDAAVREARDRVQFACRNSGVEFPRNEMMVNLAPANRKKEGSGFDLAIVCAILSANRLLPRDVPFEKMSMVGELSLSGEVKPQNGVLSLALAAREAGRTVFFVAAANAAEAAVVEGITVYGVTDLRQLLLHLRGEAKIEPTRFDIGVYINPPERTKLDMNEVRGQEKAKRAMEIAAAGGHNILLIGPPGSGKSMLAKRLPGILPDMSFAEAIETTKIHSIAGKLKGSLMRGRPFRSPHHTVSAPGLVGGGAYPRPGEISLAHNGVLFLDELPEFGKAILETLRQPLEDGVVTVTRAAATGTYPATFMMVCAMNPCRCGYFGDSHHKCTCSPQEVARYLSRISGPLLDRLDIQVELPSVSYDELSGKGTQGESSADIRERVNQARAFARWRFEAEGDFGIWSNARMTPKEMRKHCVLDEDAETLLRRAFDSLGMSARAHDRILRVARTIADMAKSDTIGAAHIAEAIQYRSLDRKYWPK